MKQRVLYLMSLIILIALTISGCSQTEREDDAIRELVNNSIPVESGDIYIWTLIGESLKVTRKLEDILVLKFESSPGGSLYDMIISSTNEPIFYVAENGYVLTINPNTMIIKSDKATVYTKRGAL